MMMIKYQKKQIKKFTSSSPIFFNYLLLVIIINRIYLINTGVVVLDQHYYCFYCSKFYS